MEYSNYAQGHTFKDLITLCLIALNMSYFTESHVALCHGRYVGYFWLDQCFVNCCTLDYHEVCNEVSTSNFVDSVYLPSPFLLTGYLTKPCRISQASKANYSERVLIMASEYTFQRTAWNTFEMETMTRKQTRSPFRNPQRRYSPTNINEKLSMMYSKVKNTLVQMNLLIEFFITHVINIDKGWKSLVLQTPMLIHKETITKQTAQHLSFTKTLQRITEVRNSISRQYDIKIALVTACSLGQVLLAVFIIHAMHKKKKKKEFMENMKEFIDETTEIEEIENFEKVSSKSERANVSSDIVTANLILSNAGSDTNIPNKSVMKPKTEAAEYGWGTELSSNSEHHFFSKTTTPSNYHNLLAKYKAGKSVGMIQDIYGTTYSTCFVVGNGRIMCNLHTLNFIAKRLAVDIKNIASEIRAVFEIGRELCSFSMACISFMYAPLDTAVLKLTWNGRSYPKSLLEYGEAVPGERIDFIGYFKGEQKMIDQDCKIRDIKELDEQDLTNRLGIFMSQNGLRSQCFPPPYDGMSTEFLYFDSAFRHGCSGSPGIHINNPKSCRVVTMLTGCFPRFLWEPGFETAREKLSNSLRFEFGPNMCALYKCMKRKDPLLCQEIFRKIPRSWENDHTAFD